MPAGVEDPAQASSWSGIGPALPDELCTPRAKDGTRSALRGLVPHPPVWLIMLAAIFYVGSALVIASLDGVGHPIDFDIYRMGAAHVLGSHLYDVRLARSLMGGVRGMHFTYPPFAALLFVPFTWLSGTAGQLIWSVLNVFALAGLAAAAIKAVRPGLSAKRACIAAAISLLPLIRLNPDALNVAYGQINFLVTLLVVVDLTRVIHFSRMKLPRGVLLGIAAAIKLTPLIFVPFLFLTRQFRAAMMATVTFLMCSLGTFVVAPLASRQFWSVQIFDTRRVGNVLYISDQNMRSALQRIVGGRVPTLELEALTLLAAVGGLLVAAWAYRASSAMLGILACAVTGLIVSPVSWAHHYVWVVPALAWLTLGADRPRRWLWWALATVVLFWAAPIWWVGDLQTGYGGPFTIVAGNAFFLAAVSFIVLAGVMVWFRHPRSDGRSHLAGSSHRLSGSDETS